MNPVHLRTLQRALKVVGNKQRLAAALEVSVPALEAYLAGEQPLPNNLFLAALDIVANGRRGG
jgi:hypothetical protein